jgi:hypothetical protein
MRVEAESKPSKTRGRWWSICRKAASGVAQGLRLTEWPEVNRRNQIISLIENWLIEISEYNADASSTTSGTLLYAIINIVRSRQSPCSAIRVPPRDDSLPLPRRFGHY